MTTLPDPLPSENPSPRSPLGLNLQQRMGLPTASPPDDWGVPDNSDDEPPFGREVFPRGTRKRLGLAGTRAWINRASAEKPEPDLYLSCFDNGEPWSPFWITPIDTASSDRT